MQYILGFTEFFGLRLKTDRRALIPRPETELLVETVVARVRGAARRASSTWARAAGRSPSRWRARSRGARVTAVDASPDALSLAAENAASTGLAGRVDASSSRTGSRPLPPASAFDLIVANPPYLSDEEAAAAAPEVRDHEPARGPHFRRRRVCRHRQRLSAAAAGALAPGGMLALETGTGHHAAAGRGPREVRIREKRVAGGPGGARPLRPRLAVGGRLSPWRRPSGGRGLLAQYSRLRPRSIASSTTRRASRRETSTFP